MIKTRLNLSAVQNLVRQALAEDLGSGDATTLAVVPTRQHLQAIMRSREDCVVAGLPVAASVYHELCADVAFETVVEDGARCLAGTTLAVVSGPARAILSGERTALNFLQRLSGIATMTARFREALGDDRIKLLDTRKTTPCLRLIEKYAVTCGGGHNHRHGLFDQVMIKDNHRAVAALAGPGGITRAVNACRIHSPTLLVEVEADTLEQVEEALAAGADIVLLDNMDSDEVREAVGLRDRLRAATLLEASGGITMDTIGNYAGTGVDAISCGALTHSPRAIDIGLDIEDPGAGA